MKSLKNASAFVLFICFLLICGCVHQKPPVSSPADSPGHENFYIKSHDPFERDGESTVKAGTESGAPDIDGKAEKKQAQKMRSDAAPGKDNPGGISGQSAGDLSLKPTRIRRERDVFIPSSLNSSEKAASSEDVVFNFDNADLYEVIRTMAELLHINYMLEPGISGNVTVQTAGKLKEKDLFGVFYQVLEANGLTAVKEGEIYKIISLKDASRMPLYSRIGRQGREIPAQERIVIQIIPLYHISAQEMSKIISPFVSAQGMIIVHDDSRTLVVVDKNINMYKVLKLVTSFDIDIFQTIMHRFYALRHVEAEEAAKLLTEIFSAYGKGEDKNFKIIPISRLNKVLAVSSDTAVFDSMETFIRQIDLPSDSAEPRIYVYAVKNGEAEDIGDLLNTVFTGKESTAAKESTQKTEKKEETSLQNLFTSKSASKEKKESAQTPKTSARTEQGSAGQVSETLRGDVRIIADKTRNALIIEAVPSDYHIIEGILKEIDVLPRQVLIEVVIAEITLDNKDELGVEWEYDRSLGDGTGLSLLTGTLGSGGLKFKVGDDRWWADFSALASENDLNVLSAPILLASDNKEASIRVTDQIPVASAEYLYDSDNGVTQTNIQYRDTGIILTVTPHINERGLVSMDISQEVSEEGADKTVGGKVYPSFRERKVDTSLTVKHGQTIIIGGLMREQTEVGVNGVPYLSKIPVIGFLFGKDKNEVKKTELILLITPRVIVSSDDVDSISEEFRQKVADMKERIAKTKEKPPFYQKSRE